MSLKAVVVGFVADLISTFTLGVVLGIVLVAQGTPPDVVAERMKEPTGLALSLILGFAGTLFGGFVTGRVAGRSEVFHGCLVGVLGVLFELLFVSQYPMWYNAACLGVVPVAMFGSWLAAPPRKSAYERDRFRGHEDRDAGW